MFADDTNVWTRISTLRDGEVLQDDLNNPMSWPDKWKLGFNPEKCKVMTPLAHWSLVGYKVQHESMGLQGKVWELEETTEERGNYQQLETKTTVC